MEPSFADATVVRSAIVTLYSQGPGHHDANTFLVAFEAADQAWSTLLQLLTEALSGGAGPNPAEQEQVFYFAANLLYSKVCKHWANVRHSKGRVFWPFRAGDPS